MKKDKDNSFEVEVITYWNSPKKEKTVFCLLEPNEDGELEYREYDENMKLLKSFKVD